MPDFYNDFAFFYLHYFLSIAIIQK